MSQHKYSNLIQINAESIGIKTIDNEIIDFLNVEIEEKVKSILSQAKKFMRVSKRKVLKVDDLNHSLRFFNFKPLFGYDSFSNAEYEKIDVVNGLWRPKQNIIDLEEYLSKPIVSCPMQVFPHFHWIAIEGKRPNIPENFIREEIKIEKEKENILPLSPISTAEINVNQPNKSGTTKVIPTVIHNISKELQIFLENFEQRFRKEIKMSKLNPQNEFKISKELEISLNVIENEPGVVELLPYIVEFLMNNMTNKQYIKDPKVHMVVLHYVDAILKNSYFYLEPYLHQLVTLILSLILMEMTSGLIDLVITVKDYAIVLLNSIHKKFEIKYPNFINQLLDIFKTNLIPRENNPCFLTTYGAIKSINSLGPTYIIEFILPKMDLILNSINQNSNLVIESFNKTNDIEMDNNFNYNSLNPSQNMLIDHNDLSQSPPKISFSIPPLASNFPITSSIFSEISNTNVINFNRENKPEEINKIISKSFVGIKNLKTNPSLNKKAFHAYYALKESATIIIKYSYDLNNEQANIIFKKLTETFGEILIADLLSSNNFSNDVCLDLNL